MSGRTLPCFETYKEKILAYASACEITVEFKDEPCDGAYMSSKRKVVIDPDLTESEEIATLLHELGHSLDDTLVDKKTFAKVNRAYQRVYVRPTQNQLELVIKCEERAWEYGRAIAKRLRIPLGKWYTQAMQEALQGYHQVKTSS